ncbi:MAG TPA: FecR domain-containing protein, partial [Flavisolibacter sp.]|nr:FecR domain-containing protein [Flavisolibacter sp.]
MSEEYLIQLIKNYAAGKASEEEVQELFNWYRSASPDAVQWPGEKGDVYNRMLQRLNKEKTVTKSRVVSFSWMKVAAVVFIIAGAAYLTLRLAKPSTDFIAVVNPSGKIQAVHLPDQSIVWLNAASELQYAKNFSEHRDIKLKGEAFFEVSHDAAHPFTVTAGELKTKVLGTSFNIKAYPAEETATVSLVTGRVEVSEKSGVLAVLQPSMQLQFNKQTHKASTAALDSNTVLAWKNGRLQFEGESFGSIAQTLERWYGVSFHFTDS